MPKLEPGRLIAEFAVIVIGILVALGVDEWREAVGEREGEVQYVERLVQDLLADSSTMARAISVGQSKMTSLDSVMQALQDPLQVRRSPSLAVPSLTFTYSRPDLQMTTFQELMATGSLSLIRDDGLRFEIGDHYRLVREHFERLDERRTRLVWAVNELFPTARGGAHALDSAFLAAPHVPERLDRLLSAEYLGLIYQEGEYSGAMESISGQIMNETTTLLAALRSYQETLR